MLQDIHYYFMQLAFEEAVKGLGVSNPNPSVGAVVVKQNRIIASGYTQMPYQEHAEIMAIRLAQKKLQTNILSECILYITLEPCHHYGKTPPCTQTIIKTGISQIIIAVLDPFPKMKGKSIRILQEAGCSVIILESKTFREQIFFTLGGFFYFIKYNRPRVFSKWAQTKNGYLAPFQNTSKAISNSSSKDIVFLLRKIFHTTMATPNTILYDQCSLTIRETQIQLSSTPNSFFEKLLYITQKQLHQKKYDHALHKRIFLLPNDNQYPIKNSTLHTIMQYLVQEYQKNSNITFITNHGALFNLIAKQFPTIYHSSFFNIPSVYTILKDLGISDLLLEAGPKYNSYLLANGYIEHAIVVSTPIESFANQERDIYGRAFPLSLQIAKLIPHFSFHQWHQNIFLKHYAIISKTIINDNILFLFARKDIFNGYMPI